MRNEGYVLYVDDEELNLDVFKGVLGEEFNILTTTSTTEAYELLKTHPVKVLISDQRMPEEDGLSFLKRIKPEFPHVIQVIFTAYQDHEVTLKAINQGGIFRYIMKPWNSAEIRYTLDSAFQSYDLQLKNRQLVKELQIQNDKLREALEHVRESDYMFYEVFTASNDGIAIVKGNKIIIANTAFRNLVGFIDTSKELFSDYIRRTNPHLLKRLTEACKTAHIEEFVIEAPDGKKSIEFRSNTIKYEGDVMAVLSVVRDVTERKEDEKRNWETLVKTQELDKNRYTEELQEGLNTVLSKLAKQVEWTNELSNDVNKEKLVQETTKNINDSITIIKGIANKIKPLDLK